MWGIPFRPAGPRARARRRARLAAAFAAALIIALSAGVALNGAFEPADLSWESFAFAMRHAACLDPHQYGYQHGGAGTIASCGNTVGLSSGQPHIVIVAYDDSSDRAMTTGGATTGFSRAATAELITRLKADGARLIILDRLYEDTRPGTAELAAAIHKAGNVVVAQEIQISTTSSTNLESIVPLEPTIAAAVVGRGIVNVPPPDATDPNARYRRYNYELHVIKDPDTGTYPPSLSLAAAWALGADPHTNQLTFLINFAGQAGTTFPRFSMADLLSGTQFVSAGTTTDSGQHPELKNAIVFVGDETQADKDYFPTPVDSADPTLPAGQHLMWGVELNAHALNTILNNDPLQRPDTPQQLLMTLPLAIIAAIWAVRGAFWSSLVVVAALTAALYGGAWLAFINLNTWIDITAPTVAVVLAPLAVLGVRLGTEQRATREVRSLFGRYVAPSVVSRIVDDPDAFGLDGVLREVTVLFSDIRSFTTLSEGMPPQQIVRMLNRYFTAMVEEIHAQGGTVDKYVGDAIMALFGAPDDQPDACARAVRAALGMQRRLAGLNEVFSVELGRTIASGIGIHHGSAAVGVIGAPSKREYSAIGDTVNTASRLEGLTKDAGYAIAVSAVVVEALPEALRSEVAPHDLGEMAVKGRAAKIRVYGLGPPIVAAIAETDHVDAGISQDNEPIATAPVG
jgi:adenylate cyclase